MTIKVLAQLLKNAGIDPTKFRVSGIEADEIIWPVAPTAEETALAADVIANYDTLAAAYQAAQMKQQAIDGIDAILDAQARELSFGTIDTAAKWTLSKNPARKARADALVAWADSMWDYAEAEWAKQAEGKGTYSTVMNSWQGLRSFRGWRDEKVPPSPPFPPPAPVVWGGDVLYNG